MQINNMPSTRMESSFKLQSPVSVQQASRNYRQKRLMISQETRSRQSSNYRRIRKYSTDESQSKTGETKSTCSDICQVSPWHSHKLSTDRVNKLDEYLIPRYNENIDNSVRVYANNTKKSHSEDDSDLRLNNNRSINKYNPGKFLTLSVDDLNKRKIEEENNHPEHEQIPVSNGIDVSQMDHLQISNSNMTITMDDDFITDISSLQETINTFEEDDEHSDEGFSASCWLPPMLPKTIKSRIDVAQSRENISRLGEKIYRFNNLDIPNRIHVSQTKENMRLDHINGKEELIKFNTEYVNVRAQSFKEREENKVCHYDRKNLSEHTLLSTPTISSNGKIQSGIRHGHVIHDKSVKKYLSPKKYKPPVSHVSVHINLNSQKKVKNILRCNEMEYQTAEEECIVGKNTFFKSKCAKNCSSTFASHRISLHNKRMRKENLYLKSSLDIKSFNCLSDNSTSVESNFGDNNSVKTKRIIPFLTNAISKTTNCKDEAKINKSRPGQTSNGNSETKSVLKNHSKDVKSYVEVFDNRNTSMRKVSSNSFVVNSNVQKSSCENIISTTLQSLISVPAGSSSVVKINEPVKSSNLLTPQNTPSDTVKIVNIKSSQKTSTRLQFSRKLPSALSTHLRSSSNLMRQKNLKVILDKAKDSNSKHKNKDDNQSIPEKIEMSDVESLRSSSSFTTISTQRTDVFKKDQRLEERIQYNRKKEKKLRMLHHALTCTHSISSPREVNRKNKLLNNATIKAYNCCKYMKHCLALVVLVRHIQTCPDGCNCEVPGCVGYKAAWHHYRRCLRNKYRNGRGLCSFCSDLWHSNNDCSNHRACMFSMNIDHQ